MATKVLIEKNISFVHLKSGDPIDRMDDNTVRRCIRCKKVIGSNEVRLQFGGITHEKKDILKLSWVYLCKLCGEELKEFLGTS
jgi:hypothetical protein